MLCLLLLLNLLLITHELECSIVEKKKENKRKEIHTCVTRGRDVSFEIQGFTIWCEFYSTKKKIYYRRREYIIEEEDKNKEKPITYKTLFM